MRGFNHGYGQTWRVTNGDEMAAFIMSWCHCRKAQCLTMDNGEVVSCILHTARNLS